ncbi:MAG: MotA/TolQ/ExbB proton channel family protein [bacterium]
MTGTVAFIVKGGPLVAVIVVLSVISISVFIERLWVMRVAAGRMRFSLFFDKVRDLMRKGDIKGVEEIAKMQKGIYGRAIQILVDKYKLLSGKVDWIAMKDNLNESMHEELAIETSLLDRNLIVMATIGSIANLIGLLGTVEGMIRSFAALSMVGASAAVASQQLAIGIAEALVNAAGGLIVAISAVIFHAYFTSKIDLFSFNIEGVSKEFITGVMAIYR